jgi:hypothetical protein
MRRSLAVGALAAAIIGAGANPAWAGGGEDSGGGEWVPVEQVIPDYYASSETNACGSTITVSAGDVREVEVRETVLPDGTVVTDFRGAATLDLTRQSDGAMIDELDISGPGHQVVSPDGTSLDVTLEGASLLSPLPGEEHFFAEAGLPDLAYFKHGEVTLHVTLDPETGETTALTADVHAHVIDLCRWFDHGHGHAHGHGPGDWR